MRQLLNDCQKIELLASEMYSYLADNQEYAEPVRQAFRHLATDEIEHSRQIDAAMGLPEGALDVSSRIAGEKVSEALQLARRFQKDILGRRLNEEDALRLAIKLEEAFVRVHLDNALHFHNQREAAVFKGLAHSDEDHLNTLRDCLKWWQNQKNQ